MSTDSITSPDSVVEADAATEADAQGDTPVAIQVASKTTAIVTPGGESGRGDVSASTIARMMGMATAAEFRVLEGKVDLLASKLNSVTGKLERISSVLANVPTGSDLERIDVQISTMRSSLNEAVIKLGSALEEGIEKMQRAQKKIDSTGA